MRSDIRSKTNKNFLFIALTLSRFSPSAFYTDIIPYFDENVNEKKNALLVARHFFENITY